MMRWRARRRETGPGGLRARLRAAPRASKTAGPTDSFMLVLAMTELAQCRACTRHIRVHESRCPFCGVAATTSAPRWIALVGIAPLFFVACSSDAGKADGPAPAKTEPAKTEPATAPEPEPKPPEPAPTTAVDPE